MLTMISVSQRTMSMMKCWESMFHARSLKNAPNLTVVKSQHNQDSLAAYQIMTRQFVSQAVKVTQKKIIAIFSTYQHLQLINLLRH
ncbi:hypothetical protein AM260_21230 [Escherichia coli]|nr:hypothetical protein AM260_21230 [Escherichia coli]